MTCCWSKVQTKLKHQHIWSDQFQTGDCDSKGLDILKGIYDWRDTIGKSGEMDVLGKKPSERHYRL